MGKRFVSIWFPHLAIDWFTLLKPQLKGKPFVLQAPAHGRMLVTAASPHAQQQGIWKGMVVADAKAICPHLEVMDDRTGLVPQLLQRAAEWAIRFSPIAAPCLPDGVILDSTGCAHLWGGEDQYIADITKRLAARGYTARVAIADTVGAAWAIVRYGKERFIISTENHLQALLPLSPAALRVEPETIDRLYKLGLTSIGDLVDMPRTALCRRFGPLLIQRLQQALGEEAEVIIPVYPPEPFQERLPCAEPILTRTGIEIGLERLLINLCTRLKKEGKGLRKAIFRCYRLDSTAQGIEISTSRSSSSIDHLFHLFNLKLSTLAPAQGIELFLLEATQVEDYLPTQENLWDKSGSMDSAPLSELLDKLAGKLGTSIVHRYLPAEHYWPERAVKRATTLDEQPQTEWRHDKPRPLQLLHTPEKIEVTAPVPDYPPMLFRYKGELHKIIKADGPERIEQEWWFGEGEHRDYYYVEDEKGRRYWLFRSGHYAADSKHQWFLHGFFA